MYKNDGHSPALRITFILLISQTVRDVVSLTFIRKGEHDSILLVKGTVYGDRNASYHHLPYYLLCQLNFEYDR